ncbi:glycosyltransferase [Nioella sp.]|uniref:glycosyltransferase n=1 Tax=Nioella sp. TaxID=1912091 RepID=UPI003B52B2F3
MLASYHAGFTQGIPHPICATKPINRVHILFTPSSSAAIPLLLKSVEKLSFHGRVDVSIFHPADTGKGILGRNRIFPGGGEVQFHSFPILSDAGIERVDHVVQSSDLIVFLSGEIVLDKLALLRAKHLLSISDRLALPIIEMPLTSDPTVGPFTKSALRTAFTGRYPFRDIQGLNIATTARLLKRTGGLDSRFSSTLLASREIAYRMFSCGSYFSPLAIPKLTPLQDADMHPEDSQTYLNTCPNHWDRKKDNLFDVPKVSVYIPAYNASRYIERAINSVLEQDVVDLNVCIANDGSRDKTLQVLEARYRDEPRVLWVDNPNGGIGFASNQAIRASKSLYVGQLDSDDCLKPGAVRRLMEYLDEHSEIVCAYGSCERIDPEGKILKNEYSWPVFSREKMMITSIVHHFRMFRRQAWERTTGFREDIANAVDYDIFLKLSEVGRFHHVDEVLYQRRWHNENTSKVNEGLQTENTYRVLTEALRRTGLLPFWEVSVPDPDEPRRVSYKLRSDKKLVMFWPDYTRYNPYQKLLYGKLRHNAQIVAGDVDAALMAVDKLEDPAQLVFHLHWTNFVFKGVSNPSEARKTAEAFLEKIRKLAWKGAKVVWTIHNHMSHDGPFPDVETWLSGELAKACHKLHFHSESSVPEVSAVFDIPREKVLISQHGSYVGQYPDYITRQDAREELGIDPDDDVIIFTGLVRPYKGVDQLVACFRKMLKERPKLRLLIVGEMRFDPFKRLSPALSTEEKSRITATDRFADDEEMQKFFRAADFAVYPYRKVLTSGSLLFALSFGVPTIIPCVGMTREVLEDTNAGLLYDGTTEGLVAAVKEMLDKKQAGDLGAMSASAFDTATSISWPDLNQIIV